MENNVIFFLIAEYVDKQALALMSEYENKIQGENNVLNIVGTPH